MVKSYFFIISTLWLNHLNHRSNIYCWFSWLKCTALQCGNLWICQYDSYCFISQCKEERTMYVTFICCQTRPRCIKWSNEKKIQTVSHKVVNWDQALYFNPVRCILWIVWIIFLYATICGCTSTIFFIYYFNLQCLWIDHNFLLIGGGVYKNILKCWNHRQWSQLRQD